MNISSSRSDGSIGPKLIRLAFPILCATVLQGLNGTFGAFWVGRCFGEAALTAVANANSMMVLLTGMAFGVTAAATILVGQCMGVDNLAGAKRVVATGMLFFAVVSTVLMVLGLVFAEPLLIMMKVAPEVLPLAVPYMRVMFLALPSMYLLAFVMSLLVAVGDSATPLKFVVLSVFLSAGFMPAFVLGGKTVLGTGGAALAVFATQATCLFVLLGHLYRRRHPLCLTRQDAESFRVDWSIVRELVRKGTPMGAQVLVISLSSVLMISLVNHFGVNTTAAYGASMQLWAYVLMPALAMAAAISSMTAQSVGAQNWVRVKRTAHVGVAYCLVVTAAIVAVLYATESYVYRIFLPTGSPALAIASHVNSIVGWSLTFMSIPLVLFGVMRAAGAVMVPLLIHVLSLLIVRYPLAAVLMDRWQADAIWWSFTTSAGVDVLLAVAYYRYGHWQRVRRLQLGEPERRMLETTPGGS